MRFLEQSIADYQSVTRRMFLNGQEVQGLNYRQVENGDIHVDVLYLPAVPFDSTLQKVVATVPAATSAEAVGMVWVALSDRFDGHRFLVEALSSEDSHSAPEDSTS